MKLFWNSMNQQKMVFPNKRVCDGGRQTGVVNQGISLRSFELNSFRYYHRTKVLMAV